jgi:hypothetical protein
MARLGLAGELIPRQMPPQRIDIDSFAVDRW